jgi:hypothetical protein
LSKLYAQITPDTGASAAKRQANRIESVWVQTQHGRIEVTLNAEGAFRVEFSPVERYEPSGPSMSLVSGNVDSMSFVSHLPSERDVRIA